MNNESLSDILQRAVALHQAGQLAEAGRLYLSILENFPEHAHVHHNLGLLAMQLHDSGASIFHFERALAADPVQWKFWLSYIQALIDMGQFAKARQVLQRGWLQAGLQGEAIDELAKMLEMPGSEAIQPLLRLFNEGLYLEAEPIARLLTSRFPDCGLAWKVLGQCLWNGRNGPEAASAMRKAVDLLPGDEEASVCYASVLHGLGRIEDAIACYKQVLHINPGNALANSCLGIIFFNLGRYGEAESWFSKTLALAPASCEILVNLGLAVQAQGRPADAERYLRQALVFSPDCAKFHHYLSIALKMQGRLEEAKISAQQALNLDPDFPEAYGNLGAIYFDQGCYAEAENFFIKTLAIKADNPAAYNNLGTSQQVQRKLLEAEASYRQAIVLDPGYAEAHANLGINLQSQGRTSEAESCWRKSLQLNPDQLATQSGLVFHLTYSVCRPDSDYLNEARKYGKMVADRAKTPFTDWYCERRPERLRIGLVSGDLRNHPVGHFLRGLLSQANSIRLDFIAYATQPGKDEFSALIRPFFADWKNIGGLSDESAAEMIRGDRIHILIDLAGHSSHNRLSLFAWKPAPIQVSWLGFLASTGVEAIDYILTDRYAIRPEDERNFTEKTWRMPDSSICFTPSDSDQPVEVNSLPALSRAIITFGSFNNLAKMGDTVVALWSRVLKSVPNSRLFLKASQLNEPANCDRTRQRFAAFGVSADRLVMTAAKASHVEHLMAYHDIDIALDTFPYPGVTTSVESLWMGVPVLTMRGDGILSRAGESININAGLGDWIAESEDDFVAKASLFAGNRLQLSALRCNLRARVLSSMLFDHSRFSRHFDEALWGMWHDRFEKN